MSAMFTASTMSRLTSGAVASGASLVLHARFAHVVVHLVTRHHHLLHRPTSPKSSVRR
eukprot:CAMPEP_0206500852 /NCGR_PEP_ID=MMETSP0324_2-20121206/52894_1 /ASSEMBLY_ACC=CAM_ASM_000836 /TAXON_ID=2866 /ORGANISM="Crypthecodinium cohnii, Strain Seligo" /LENGTH=57 /DNA_ID=CAMNT_0053988425 /DNA_START=115 /DNA_END=284 /DNA_ORIENTATION=+